jgi:hypothetical protein
MACIEDGISPPTISPSMPYECVINRIRGFIKRRLSLANMYRMLSQYDLIGEEGNIATSEMYMAEVLKKEKKAKDKEGIIIKGFSHGNSEMRPKEEKLA